jgi:hypothetical protein
MVENLRPLRRSTSAQDHRGGSQIIRDGTQGHRSPQAQGWHKPCLTQWHPTSVVQKRMIDEEYVSGHVIGRDELERVVADYDP